MNSLLRTRYSITSMIMTLVALVVTTTGYSGTKESESIQSDEAKMEMNAICPPPIISTQPQAQTTCLGTSVTFTVVASTNGPGTIVYQWKKAGVSIAGATASSYTIASVTLANAGNYTCTITKSCGAVVTTMAAALSVNNITPGEIGGEQSLCSGATAATLTNVVAGTASGALTYQWEESTDNSTWNAIAGATDLTYEPGEMRETKYYRRSATSLLNGITCYAASSPVQVSVILVVATASSNSPLCEGEALILTADGGSTYAWSGPEGFTASTQNPTIGSTPLNASGTYAVTVTGASGCTASVETMVTINPKPAPTATNNSPVCEGASLSLSSCGGTLFLWSGPLSYESVEKQSTISEATLAHAGEYSVMVTNSYGCTALATTIVVVNPNPAVAANNSGPTCEGNQLNLSASGGDTYSWTGPGGFTSSDQNPSISNVTVSASGTYSVVVTNEFGCVALATTDVLINALPEISVSTTDSINQGGMLSLNSHGGVTYSWVGPNGFVSSEQNPSILEATVSASGTYTVTVTSSDGCISSATVSVVVFVVAPHEASNDSPADEGGTISLRSGDGDSYYWEGPNGFTSTEQNPVIENATAENSGTYTVVVTDAYGNTFTSSTEVLIFPAPSASSNGSTCEGSIINLSASGGESYSWAGPNGFTSSEQNPIITAAQLASGGTYTVTVTRSDASTRTATTELSVNPSYSVSLPSVSNCDAYTLPWGQEATVSGDYSHVYSSVNGCDSVVNINVSINSSYQVAAAPVSDCASHLLPWGTEVDESGEYSHTYLSSSGCDSTVTVQVTINPVYEITADAAVSCDTYTLPWGEVVTVTGDYSYTYPSVNACDSTVNIHVTINSSYNVEGDAVTACDNHTLPWGETATTPGTYVHTYTTVNGCDSTVSIKVDLNQSYDVVAVPVKSCNSHTLAWGDVVTTSGTYSHTYSSIGGCDSTVSVQVTVNQSYAVTGASVDACSAYTLPWGEIALTTDNYDYTYAAVSGCDSTVTIHVTIHQPYTMSAVNVSGCGSYTLPWGDVATASGDYAHVYSSLAGCDSTVTYHVTINQASASASSTPACTGQTMTLSAEGGVSYSWTGPNGFSSTLQNPSIAGITGAVAGTYTVTVLDANGCSASATTDVSVSSVPTATASATTPVTGGKTLYLSATGGGSYSWSGPNGFTSTLQNPSITSVTWMAEGTYTVTVTNAAGCTAEATVAVDVNCKGFMSYTITQGGWGAVANGSNPATYRNANFPYAFPSGLVIGWGNYWITLTGSISVQDFLPTGGTPRALTQSYTNPTANSYKNTLAGQVTALALNIGFDNYDANFAVRTTLLLKDLFVASGPLQGWSASQVLAEAQKVLGGGTSQFTAQELSDAATAINQNYDNGNVDKGFLSCVPLKVLNPPTEPVKFDVSIYPNPTAGLLNIKATLPESRETQVDIELVSVLGQVMFTDRTYAEDGHLSYQITLDNSIPAGNYFARIIAGDQVALKQVIIQK